MSTKPKTIEAATREIVYVPGAAYRFAGNGDLALAYSRDDKMHHVAISKRGSYPTDLIVLSVLNVLITEYAIRNDTITQSRDQTNPALGPARKIVRISWPLASPATQLELGLLEPP